jgi:transposase-like protein
MKNIDYDGYRFPPAIIQQAIWLYFRFTLRNVQSGCDSFGAAVRDGSGRYKPEGRRRQARRTEPP